MIQLWLYPLLFLTGLVAGFVDSIAGGGGLISLPVPADCGDATTGRQPRAPQANINASCTFISVSAVTSRGSPLRMAPARTSNSFT